MTLDRAVAHLEGIRNDWKGRAAHYRKHGDEYKRAANEGCDEALQAHQFEESSAMYANARQYDRDADALDLVLAELKVKP